MRTDSSNLVEAERISVASAPIMEVKGLTKFYMIKVAASGNISVNEAIYSTYGLE